MVVVACLVPIYLGGLSGVSGLALHTPDCKGPTETSCDGSDKSEDDTSTDVSDVGVEDTKVIDDKP